MYRGKFEKTIEKCKKNKLKYTIYTDVPERIEAGAVSYMKLTTKSANYRLSINEIDEDGVEFKLDINGEISYVVIPFENILCVEMNE